MTADNFIESLVICEWETANKDIQNCDFIDIDCDVSNPALIAIASSGNIYELLSGAILESIATMEASMKPLCAFSFRNFPDLFAVSLVGGTVVFRYDGNRICELDQTQTRIALTESSIFCCDIGANYSMQVTKTWINVFTATGNTVYRCEHGNRISASISECATNRIAVGLTDGELRGKGRVLLLEVSPNGQFIEMFRKDFTSEIVGLVITQDCYVALAADNSLYLLTGSLVLKSHLVLNSPVRSVSNHGNNVFVSSTSGGLSHFIVEHGSLKLLSNRILVNEPVTLVKERDRIYAFSHSRTFVIAPDFSIERIQCGKDSSGFCDVTDSLKLVVSGGEISLMRSMKSPPSPSVFDGRLLTSVPSLSGWLPLQQKNSIFLLRPNDSPLLWNRKDKSLMSISSLGPVACVCDLSLGNRLYLLTWGSESGLVLTDTDQFKHVWAIPLSESVAAMTQISVDKVMVAFSTGDLAVFEISESVVPKRVSLLSCHLRNIKRLACSNGRIFLIDIEAGIFTLIYRSTDSALLFTSVSPLSDKSPITASALMDHDRVVIARTNGVIEVYRLPASMAKDEASQLQGLVPGSMPDMCMTVPILVGSYLADGISFTSAVHCGDERNIVYLSTLNGKIFGVYPNRLGNPGEPSLIKAEDLDDELLRFRLTAHVAWD
jgi:hypothetical protein